jgi:TPR repeat protein
MNWYQRIGIVAGMLLFCFYSEVALHAQTETQRGYTYEEYAEAIVIRRLNSRKDASVDKIKLQVELERIQSELAEAKIRMKTPDATVSVLGGGTRTISNETTRQSATEDVKRLEARIATVMKLMLIADTRIAEFDKARVRGFIPIRNGANQQIEVSPVGFKNGELKFIKYESGRDDLISFTFSIDEIQYGSLVDAVRFLVRYAGDIRHSLEEVLKVNEKTFFERISVLDFDINHPRKETPEFIARGGSAPVDEKLRIAQNSELRSYNTDLRKSEANEWDNPIWEQLESDANKTNQPNLDWALSQRYLLSGKGRNLQKARRYAERAVQQGNAHSFLTLGNCYNENYLTQVGFRPNEITGANYETARTWYLKAVENGSAGALWELGLMHFWGLGIPANTTQGVEYFRETALRTDKIYAPKACFMLGVLYYQGNGIGKDHEKSVYWLKTAANMNPDSEAASKAKSFLGKNTFDIKKN